MTNPFFKNCGPFNVSDILRSINLDNPKIAKDQKITEFKVFIRPLQGLNALHKLMGMALKSSY